MMKKGKISSGVEHSKNFKKTTTSINNKKDTQSNRKATYTKSVDKKKPYGVIMEQRVLNSNEGKAERDKKVNLTKQRKDNSVNNRNVKTNKGKEYQNNLNKLTEDNEVEKEYDFFNFKLADEYKKKLDNRAKPNNEDQFSKSTNVKPSKLTSYKDQKSDQDIKRIKKMQKNKTANIADDSDEEEESEKDDILHRLFYKPVTNNKRPDADKNKIQKKAEEKEKQKEKERQKEREKAKSKENQKKLLSYQQSNDKMAVSMEKTDDMSYNVDDKKIYSNKKKKNDAKDSNTKGSSKKATNLGIERTVDFFVIDGDDDIEISSRYKKKIDRKRNRYKEICIERSNVFKPDKMTGFILIRKSKGKKIYELLLEDNIDKSNGILKNNEIKIKGEIIQLISLDQLIRLRNELDQNKHIVNELQSELRAREYSKEMDKNKDKDKVREKDKQISTLKSKHDELNNLVRKQDQQIIYLEKEMKQLQLSYDLLKESYKDLEKENKSLITQNKSLIAQNQSNKVNKNVFPRKIDSKEIKGRQKNYNNELKKVPTKTEDDEENEKNINKKEENKPVEEYDYNADFVVGGRDAKSQKMKNAVNRFTKKYKDVIKEEKKAKEEREREEKERLENEERELEDDEYWENNDQQKQEMERIERENRERREKEERDKKEKEERERKSREERERQERERREIERREIERKLIEERVRKEREARERERKEKEERDRQDRERRERDRQERERKERERKEKEERDRQDRERKEKEKREKEKKEKHVKIAMAPARQNKMMGGNFAKMLADKLKMAPPGMRKGGVGGMQTTSKPPIQDNVDVVTLLEEAPFEGKTRKRKPSRKVFIEKIVDDEEESD